MASIGNDGDGNLNIMEKNLNITVPFCLAQYTLKNGDKFLVKK